MPFAVMEKDGGEASSGEKSRTLVVDELTPRGLLVSKGRC